MNGLRCRFVTLVFAVALSTGPPAGAQRGAVTLSVDDGARATPIARLVEGRWVSAGSCVPNNARAPLAGRERVMVTGDMPVQSVRAVGPGTEEWVRLAPTILGLFDRREREQRLTPDRTAGAPRVVDWIYAADEAEGRMYYFEASRRIASNVDADADTDPPGTLRIAVAGFLRQGRAGPASLGTKSELRWEQDGLPAGPSRPDLTPLGVLIQSDRSVWVMRGQSGASTWFSLYELSATSTRTALTVRPARC